MLAASLVSTLAALIGYSAVDRLIAFLNIDGLGVIGVALLAARIAVGMLAASVVYFLLARFLGIDDAVPMLNRLANRFLPRRAGK